MSPVNPKQQGSVLRSILDDDTRQLVQDEKRVLTTVCDRLAETDGSDPDIALLRTIVKQLDELFMLVVVGEFNSGKSSFINTLLGEFYLFIYFDFVSFSSLKTYDCFFHVFPSFNSIVLVVVVVVVVMCVFFCFVSGNNYLAEGVTPTTAEINILRYGDKFVQVDDTETGSKNVFVPQVSSVTRVLVLRC